MVAALGLMSGTSLDGVDVALIETDGERVLSFGPCGYRAYDGAARALLRQALDVAVSLSHRGERPGVVAAAEQVVTRAHAEAVSRFMAENGLSAQAIDIVGFHGQTVLHRPERRLTVQIGDGAELSRLITLPVVHDLRAADVASGGQGAPLAPVYHRALARMLNIEGPLIVLNIGGVSNITYIDGEDSLIACDTGPGNALLDDFMARHTGQALDANGGTAAQGRVDETWIDGALRLPFFAKAAPKSLDRNDFAGLDASALSLVDGAATLTAFTAAAISRIIDVLPRRPRGWIVCGGGAHNATMLAMLRQRLAPAWVETAQTMGWASDALEAQAFAFLAVRSLKGLPLSYPTTTGVREPLSGGVLARP